MSIPKAIRKGSTIVVSTDLWTVQHDVKAGGCWTSLVFTHGTGKNLLAAPVSARVRTLELNPKSDASSPFFFESKFEKNAEVTVETLASGVVVTASGALRLQNGDACGVTFKQRYEYRDFGLVACELELSSAEGRNDLVEISAVEMILREGMTDAYVREHPMVSPSSDLVGLGRWYTLTPGGNSPYMSRYVPNHIVCFEKGKEGIEFSCSSDIAAWDTGFNSDVGLGLYDVRPSWGNPKETMIALSPYCTAYRRNTTQISGTHRLRYYLGIPGIKPAEKLGTPYFHLGIGSDWVSDADLESIARSGVKLIRFHNDYRENGPFWHDGMYPPYDAKGMAELRRIVDTSHRLGMKIIPYISVKEFHPESSGCKENQVQWRQQPGPTFPELHTWAGSGEFGQLMCLESGWLDFRKKSIDIILDDIPWDGLYFDWCTPHNCRNPHHNGGRIHSDQDAFYEFMFWVRERVGPDGIILTHLSGLPQVVVENMATMSLIYEDQNYSSYPRPDKFPVQCEFIPIVPRILCAHGTPNTPVSRQTIMSGLLQGTPGCGGWNGSWKWKPLRGKFETFSAELLTETAGFGDEVLADYNFTPASKQAVATGSEDVYAALWHRKDRALIYVGNWSPKPAKGALKIDPSRMKWNGSAALEVLELSKNGKAKPAALKLAALKSKGIPYALKPWSAALYSIER
jgi:hypothetical protein